ncbi:hypothetical protein FGB62_94g068 [Gracilaria domingensis]|nr:hypothetical protein FGB62_94g068 [Gracilaria domingensis]
MDKSCGTNVRNGQKKRHSESADVEKPLNHRQVVESCMNCLVLVALKDGRLVEGKLDCYDKQGNMILVNASDVTRETDKPFGRSFRLGTVMVPGGVTSQVLVHTQKDSDNERTHSQSLPNYIVGAAGDIEHSSQPSGAFKPTKIGGEEPGEQTGERRTSAN